MDGGASGHVARDVSSDPEAARLQMLALRLQLLSMSHLWRFQGDGSDGAADALDSISDVLGAGYDALASVMAERDAAVSELAFRRSLDDFGGGE